MAENQNALRVFIWDAKTLAHVKQHVASGDGELKPALDRLRGQAEEGLGVKPVSVMDKEAVPPSGDKHDYMSMGPYRTVGP